VIGIIALMKMVIFIALILRDAEKKINQKHGGLMLLKKVKRMDITNI